MSIRILLADDHAIVRDGLRMLLEAEPGMDVVADVPDGRLAVQQAIRLQPDVAILDIAMPSLNGIEAAMQIHSARPEIRVIILSMYATREHIFRAFQAGAQAYLLKESAGKEVAEAVRTVYAGQRYLSSRITDLMINEFVHLQQDGPQTSPLEKLSAREREILQMVVEGRSSAEVGAILHLSPKTVETYRSRLMEKLGINDLPGLVKFAIQHGMTSLE